MEYLTWFLKYKSYRICSTFKLSSVDIFKYALDIWNTTTYFSGQYGPDCQLHSVRMYAYRAHWLESKHNPLHTWLNDPKLHNWMPMTSQVNLLSLRHVAVRLNSGNLCKIALRRMPHNRTSKMPWVTNRYVSQCWPILSPYEVTRPQWVSGGGCYNIHLAQHCCMVIYFSYVYTET